MLDTPLRILQANVNKSLQATETILDLGIRSADLILIQEPWIIQDQGQSSRSVLHSAYQPMLPRYGNYRPRVIIYAKRSLLNSVELVPQDIQDPDAQGIIVKDKTNKSLQILNVYNEQDSEGTWTLERTLYSTQVQPNCILGGDFNIRHPCWDPNAHGISSRAKAFVEWIEEHRFACQNIPNKGTFYRTNMESPSVLDLTFFKGNALREDANWHTRDIGSDHQALSFVVHPAAQPIPPPAQRQSYNTAKANWAHFEDDLRQRAKGLDFTAPVEVLAESFSAIISEASKANIPQRSQTPHSKPWWTPGLREMRRTMSRAYRRSTEPSQSPETRRTYQDARNRYFQAIKDAKRAHWNQFLEKSDPHSIFKAFKYTKASTNSLIPTINGQDTFASKCREFRETLFPEPPEDTTEPQPQPQQRSNTRSTAPSTTTAWEWAPLDETELCNACSTANVKGKTPGPDGITQEIIHKAYKAIPVTFLRVFNTLIYEQGHHPICWRKAIGVILAKPHKPSYEVPKAYRVISLLNCLGKVSERIVANRLSTFASDTTRGLLHPSQMGGRKQRSAVDAALLLTDFVEGAKARHQKASVALLDIKGAFDHVSKTKLLKIMDNLQLPEKVKTWTQSFLENRQLQLTFNGQIEELSPVKTGVPQGSPVSPILFLIYVSGLAKDTALDSNSTLISYIDDIAIATKSTSWKKNSNTLQKAVHSLTRRGEQQAIQFDLAKTELLHFGKGKGTNSSITLPSGDTVQPATNATRWLGIWFDKHLTFKDHIRKRTVQAHAAFERMQRLANTEKGLTTQALRQLYMACVTSVADYGAPVWWKPNRSVAPLQAIQSKAARKILGVFRTTPIEPTEVEAALLPPKIRLERQVALYGLRLQRIPDNPTAKALENTSRPVTQTPISNGVALVKPKCTTRLQAIKLRNGTLQGSPGDSKAQIWNAAKEAWRKSFDKARSRKQGSLGSYFRRFNFKPRTAPAVRCDRTTSSAYYSLLFGHGYLKGYLKRIGKTDEDQCQCGRKETPEHLIFACPRYRGHRPRALREAFNLEEVHKTKPGRKALIKYLQDTKIATRKWYQGTLEEEDYSAE